MQTFEQRLAYGKQAEDWFIEYLNVHEDGTYKKQEGWNPVADVSGKETYEIKSFKERGDKVYIPKKTYINCQAKYYAFVEVNLDGSPTGYALVAKREEIEYLIREKLKNEDWELTRDGRDVISFKKHWLMDQNSVIYVNPSTTRKIEDLLVEKLRKSLD